MNVAKRKKLFRLGMLDSSGKIVNVPKEVVEVHAKVEPQVVVEEVAVEVPSVVDEAVVATKSKKVKKVVESE